MDERLLAWGRAVKQRQRNALPALWLFTDTERIPDPLPAIGRLPRGLCGVVFRHDGAPGRWELARQVAKLCRRRGLPLVVAGDARLAAGLSAGMHLRGGRWPSQVRVQGLLTASAHTVIELRRAKAAGAKIIFLSPAFATTSHPESSGLNPVRWRNIARQTPGAKIYSLGGVTGRNAAKLLRFCAGAGAIKALES
jgi:thiamine-phosphate pyrophosphorylase